MGKGRSPHVHIDTDDADKPSVCRVVRKSPTTVKRTQATCVKGNRPHWSSTTNRMGKKVANHVGDNARTYTGRRQQTAWAKRHGTHEHTATYHMRSLLWFSHVLPMRFAVVMRSTWTAAVPVGSSNRSSQQQQQQRQQQPQQQPPP